jgi:hypothetical protein
MISRALMLVIFLSCSEKVFSIWLSPSLSCANVVAERCYLFKRSLMVNAGVRKTPVLVPPNIVVLLTWGAIAAV